MPPPLAPGDAPAAEDALDRLGSVAKALAIAAWVALLAVMLRQRIFVSNDSVSNYVHVWWIADRLWHGHGLPLHFPLLGHGQALTYPYGFVPWTFAALLWPLLGDRATTLMLVLGGVGLIVATFIAFPELRRGWWAAAVLVNPLLVAAVVIGQGPFMWGASFLLLGVAAWRRGRPGLAAVVAGVGALTHPAIVLPLLVLFVVLGLVVGPARERRSLLRAGAVACAISLPGVVAVFASPVMAQTDTRTKVVQLAGTLGTRVIVVGLPLVLVGMQRLTWRGWGPLAFVLILVANPLAVPGLGMHYAWLSLRRTPNETLLPFIRSPLFERGATYRILRAADGKIGMYQLVRNGAVLDAELFPESINRKSYQDASAYSRFLRDRQVDYVLDYHNYDAFWHTNEHALLEQLADAGSCGPTSVGVERVHREARFDLYHVTRSCPAGP